MAYYRAPIDPGWGRVGDLIAGALSSGASSVAGGLQERYNRDQEAERKRLEQERYDQQRADREEEMALRYGPRVTGDQIRQTMSRGSIEMPGGGTTELVPEVVTAPRTAPSMVGIEGGPQPVETAPRTHAALTGPNAQRRIQATERRPGLVDLGAGNYRDLTDSFAWQQGELERGIQQDAANASVRQAAERYISLGIDPVVARAMAEDEAVRDEQFGQRTDERRHGNRLEEIRVQGEETRRTNRERPTTSGAGGLTDLQRRNAMLAQAEGHATMWARDGASADDIAEGLMAAYADLDEGDAYAIAASVTGEEAGDGVLTPAQALALVGDYDAEGNPYTLDQKLIQAQNLVRAWKRGPIGDGAPPPAPVEDEPGWFSRAWEKLTGGGRDTGTAATPATAAVPHASIPADLLQIATDEQLAEAGFSPEEIATARRSQR